MQKDVISCKDCLYRGTELCPIKTEEWTLGDNCFCFAGAKKPTIRTGTLLKHVNDDDYLLVVGFDNEEDPDIYYCITLEGTSTFPMKKEDLYNYILLGTFPYMLIE